VCFPVGERGAHKLWNATDARCEVLMFANSDAGDVCYYPDSRKHVVDCTDTLVRSEPQLDYYEGEV
jgi:uncharacterized cupin superfamily protein